MQFVGQSQHRLVVLNLQGMYRKSGVFSTADSRLPSLALSELPCVCIFIDLFGDCNVESVAQSALQAWILDVLMHVLFTCKVPSD